MKFSVSVSFRAGLTVAVLLAGFLTSCPCFGQNSLDTAVLNRGNIQTTISNNGLIGCQSTVVSGCPSGEWPAGSGHNYLKEMYFFIGGINQHGDTLVDTNASFNPLDSVIRVSTDHSTYDYNISDDTGLEIGFPAYGWRVWDPDSGWVYEKIVKHCPDYAIVPGGPVASQETICRYKGNNTGLKITQITRQWDFDPYQDMIFFTLLITNDSDYTLDNVALGLYSDFDIGGTNPYNPADHGQNDDIVKYDISLDMGWMGNKYDYDIGWNGKPGVMGTRFLSKHMTRIHGYLQGKMSVYYDRNSLSDGIDPNDWYYLQSAFPAGSLFPDSTIRFDFVLLAASNELLLKKTANVAGELFGDSMVVQRPPNPPIVRGSGGAHCAFIIWDSLSEASIDPASCNRDFRGYKIYRSDDRGLTWGNHIEDAAGNISPDFQPLTVMEFTSYTGDTSIPHNFIDSELVNGREYWYAVVAYDTSGLQNAYQGKDPDSVSYIVKVFPRADPLGYTLPESMIRYVHAGAEKLMDDSISISVIDPDSVTGHDYVLYFSDLGDCHRTWDISDVATNNLVLTDQTQFEGLPFTFPVVNGLQVAINNPRVPDTVSQSNFGKDGDTTTAITVTQFSSESGCDRYFTHDYRIEFTHSLTDIANFTDSAYWSITDVFLEVLNRVPFKVWNSTDGSRVACWFNDKNGSSIWNPENGEEIIISDYSPGDTIPFNYFGILTGYDRIVWTVSFDPLKGALPDSGDIFEIKGAHLYTSADTFYFSTRQVDASLVPQNLKKIHVVPNPYLANASWELEQGTRKIQFVNLPDICTIRIYTLAGDLITTLEHTDGSGAENWDLMSEGRRSIAAGIYVYHVESKYGNFVGKFAVIK